MSSDHVEVNTENLTRGAAQLDPVKEVITNIGNRTTYQVNTAVPGFGSGQMGDLLHGQVLPGIRSVTGAVLNVADLTGQAQGDLYTATKNYTKTNDENTSAINLGKEK